MSSRWPTLAMLFGGNVLNYLDRTALSVAAPLIAVELHLRPSALGALFSAFFVGYTGVVFLGGYGADRFGPKPVIAAAAASWSLLCALTAAPLNFASLMVVRMLFGAAEAPYIPSANKMIGRLFPPKAYGGALALSSAGQPIGGFVAGPIVGALILAFGWRISFVCIGALGIIWALVWWRIAPGEPKRPAVVAGTGTPNAPRLLTLLGLLIRNPAVLAVTLAYFGFAYVLYFFLTWFPSYLVDALHLSFARMSVATAVPWLMGLAGLVAGGFLSDSLMRWHWGPLLGRKLILVGGLAAAAVGVGFAGSVTTATAAVTLMGVAAFFIYLTGVTYFGILQEVVPEQHRGGAAGFALIGSSSAGVAAPALTGAIVEATGSFTNAFATAGVVAMLGAGAVLLLVRKPRTGPR